jgi:hypothetical protein
VFGLIHACSRTLDGELLTLWRAHLCGLCLCLRDSRGQLSRALTNTDAVMLSVLVEAQQAGPAARSTAGPCPLRGMRTAQVVPASSVAARLGATASVALAAAKAQDVRAERVAGVGADHVGVKDRAVVFLSDPLRRRTFADPPIARAIDAGGVLDVLSGQAALEATPGTTLTELLAPTATATGQIFAAAAGLAGVPANEPALRRIGEAFGALAHLLDAVEDLDEDRRSGAFNPLSATGTSVEGARHLAHNLERRIRDGVDELELADDRLVRALLVRGVHSATHRVFDGGNSCATASAPGPRVPLTKPDRPDPQQTPPEPPPVPPPAPPPGPRSFWPNLLPWLGVYCTGYACCASHTNPCTGKRHDPGCSNCDGCDCDCCGDGCCCDC